MRLSDLGDKEIINLSDGSHHGLLSNAELLFEEKNGEIKAILMPALSGGKFHFFGDKDYIQMPWSAIRKIGIDIIIFET